MTDLIAPPACSATSAEPAPPSIPSRAEAIGVIPSECFERNLGRSLAHTALSVGLTVATGLAAWAWLPLTWAFAPLWIVYAVVAGTFATGVWVLAHECGHRAFCNGTRLQDGIGFVLHSSLLVPYFSWQRSHMVHHAKTNHLVEGETHVPKRADEPGGQRALAGRRRLGRPGSALLAMAAHLLAGWPLYLLAGATGGPERGTTNHFWPTAPFSDELFPGRWKRKVRLSALGVLAVIGLLIWWAVAAGPMAVVALYVGPYLVTNAWVVAYTWLQHTDVDIPHYEGDDWSYVRGVFCSVDRPYGRFFDLLHHRIGSTHVAHHLEAKIPHYRAKVATDALAVAYPDLYRYDPTPVPKALWRVAGDCQAVTPAADGWEFVRPQQ